MRAAPLKKKRPYSPPENRLKQLAISEVFINKSKARLSEPILLNIQFEDQHYIVSHDDLGLLAVGDSRDRALDEIQMEFSELWEEYVICSDDELTEGAKRLRAKLKRPVE